MLFNVSIAFAAEDDEAYDKGYKDGNYDGYDYVMTVYGERSPSDDEDVEDENEDKAEDTNTIDIPATPGRIRELDDRNIENRYSRQLSGQTRSYVNSFIDGYKDGFEAGYIEARARLLGEEAIVEVELNYAESLGESLGEIYAYDDFYKGSRSNWSRAIPTDRQISNMFDLDRQTSEYRRAFLSEFKVKFQEAYEEAFEHALLFNIDTINASAVTDGYDIGFVLGSIYGDRDYFEGRSFSSKRDLPSDSSIRRDYNLSRLSDDYQTGFINGFKQGYEEGYTEGYYNSYKEADESGKTAGVSKGQMMASKDYIENKDMDWTRHKSLSSAISAEYRLIYLSNSYRGSFLNGFWIGFSESYDATYKELIGGQVTEKIAFDIMTIAGGTLAGADGSIILDIEPGSFYNDTAVSIERVFNEKYSFDQTRYIKASDIYNIEISNPSKNLNNSKSISIAMEYYGDESGGIYKWVDGKWTYLSSLVEEGGIIAQINPNTIRPGDNIYTILLDRNHDLLTDVRSHWAKEEINAMVRRNIITGYPDETFRPERNISRAEFLTLLSRAYNWTLPRTTTNIDVFEDYSTFNYYDKVISYGISHGLIIGYPDETFRPGNPISYKEIELIMARLLDDPNFKWYNTSARMLYEKQVKSSSYNSINNKITRAEVSYMLYILNEWRY